MSEDNEYEHRVVTDGVTAFIPIVEDGGQKITVSGWRMDRGKFKEGDRILLVGDGNETRYRIVKRNLPSDPDDMFFWECEFLPRSGPSLKSPLQ